MEKIRMQTETNITFEQLCNAYLLNCKQRNLRSATLNHYRQSMECQFYKYFNPAMPATDFNQTTYDNYIVYLTETLTNDISINSYLRDLITILHFAMRDGYIEPFKMKTIKADSTHIETYTDDELRKLLAKPNVKTCSFTQYEAWVLSAVLLSTGLRQRSFTNIKIKDVDFDNRVIYVNVTKNRKQLIMPFNYQLSNILTEYLRHRRAKTPDDYLFCNSFGRKLAKSTGYMMIYDYNKQRGVEKTGLHRYRHTFAKQWILNGGNVVVLSRLLGHSNLAITQNYINLLVSDVAKQVDTVNILNNFTGHQKIKMNEKRRNDNVQSK